VRSPRSGSNEDRESSLLRSVEGVYRDGKIELSDLPKGMPDGTRVIVTFIETDRIGLRERGMNEARAAEVRAQLQTFTEDWDSPDMAIYDDYDAAKAKQ
jgi:hypothetical protein